MRHDFLNRLRPWLLVPALLAPVAALAWWDAAYTQRTQVSLNTSAQGVATRQQIDGLAVPVRLHSGNFDFLKAQPDGRDLRVLSADDKTPLKFSVERFDGAGELAVLWVQWPTVAPGTDQNRVHVYAGNASATAEPAAGVVDRGAALTLRFSEPDGTARDAGGSGLSSTAPFIAEPSGLIGPSARFDGSRALSLPASNRVQAAAGAAYAVSLWAKPAGAGGTVYSQGPLSLALAAGKAQLRLGSQAIEGGQIPPNAWVQLVATLGGGQLTLYVNGQQAAQAPLAAAAPAVAGAVQLAQGFSGLLDEVQVVTEPRSSEQIAFIHAAQAADARLIASQSQSPDQADAAQAGHGSYFGVLFDNLTIDAWVVIIILAVMFVVAAWVMVAKALLIGRTDRGNSAFLRAFRSAQDVLKVGQAGAFPGSSIAQLYEVGVQQLAHRRVGEAGGPRLSGLSLNAVSASVNADLVRQNQHLNSLMVLLTIAISGGPFLGLLGTVVGVMITFAAIAAAGDVNVNAIAPGIAAALLATVAGLAVAIPALFGYNYLAARIKNISSDMQIFIDEFITRVAEQYGEADRASGPAVGGGQ